MGQSRLAGAVLAATLGGMTLKTPIQFWFDFSSPYSYLANEWIDALAARHGRTVQRRAILLGVVFQAAELKSPVSYPLKSDYAWRDFARSARFEGLPYQRPEPFPIPTQLAARVFGWLQAEQGEAAAAAWAQTVFRAIFTRNVQVQDAAQLRSLAEQAGLDANQAEAAWNNPVWKNHLRAENQTAIAAGVFGAPFFVVDGEPFWGNDRKEQLERWLAQEGF
jgi:2-hydroxychromene-2-carboxylate isomerase